jgi:hypothetical protein
MVPLSSSTEDFIAESELEREIVRDAQSVGAAALFAVWNNDADSTYDSQ